MTSFSTSVFDSCKKSTLDPLATKYDLSPAYLQRKFKRVVGITPRQYTEASRLVKFKLELRRSQNIAIAIYLAGYNSSSSLYEQISSKLGMTPKIYQQHGKQTTITYTIVSCELGYLLVATTKKGICAVKLGDRPEELRQTLTDEFKQAIITEDNRHHRDWIEKILNLIVNKPDGNLPLDIRGTAFQYQVWQALQKIPYAETRTYKEIAQDINKPNATRAIGNACGANPVALIVPCHRVIRSNGNLGGYRWGIERKQKLLAIETKIKSLSPEEK